MPEFREIFADRLRLTLERTGVSQKALAEKIESTQSTIQRWLNKEVDPSLVKVALAADFLNVSMNYLLGIEDVAVSPPEKIISDLQKLLNVQSLAPVEPIRKGPELPDHVSEKVIRLLARFPKKTKWVDIEDTLEGFLVDLGVDLSNEEPGKESS